MKKIIGLFLALFLCFGGLFCVSHIIGAFPVFADSTDSANNSASNSFDMELVARFNNRDLAIYREPVTEVLYIVYNEYHGGGVSVMLDPENGHPLTYARYLELYNGKEFS